MTQKTLRNLKECFLGEVVVFYLRDMNVAAFTDEGDQLKISGMIDGLVVDIDEDYYYLGDDEGGIEKVISHDSVAVVEIAKTDEGIFDRMMGFPSEEEDIH